MVAPHPDTDDPDLHRFYRRMLDSRHNSNTSSLNDSCWDSWEECEEESHHVRRQGRRLQALAQPGGLVRTLVVLMQFTDHLDRTMVPVDDIRYLLSGEGTDAVLAPTGTVRSYLQHNSYRGYTQEFDVMPWIVTDNTEHFYSHDRSGLTNNLKLMLHPVFDQLEARGLDWTRYDLDGDGVVDGMLVIHSGYPAEIGLTDCYGTHYSQRIWSQRRYDGDWTSSRTGIRSGAYSVAPSKRGYCNDRMETMGIFVHEFLHLFGLPDLLDTSGEWIGRGLGVWDVMGVAKGVDLIGNYPAHLSAWSKIQLGWVQPMELTSDGLYRIRAAEEHPDIYIIKSPYPEGEHLLIENRQPIRWDAQLWNGGLLIWHIDDAKSLQRERGYPGQEAWPLTNRHYQIALMQADGRYDLERGVTWGDDGDYYRSGREIGPGPEEAIATPPNYHLYPNTNSYRWGNNVATGLRIHDISASQYAMTFRVSGLQQQQPASRPLLTRAPTPSPGPPTASPVSRPKKSLPNFCFSNVGTVDVLEKGPTPMSHVKIGDLVLTQDQRYEPVYCFGHYHKTFPTNYLQLHTAADTTAPTHDRRRPHHDGRPPLEVTSDHMVFVNKHHAVPASMIEPGDEVWLSQENQSAVVERVTNVTRRGAYAPFTPSGTIVVDGYLASTYVAFQDSPFLRLGQWTTPLTHQWLGQKFEILHRIVCLHWGDCTNEGYTETGVSLWMARPHQLSLWMIRQPAWVMTLMMTPYLCIILFLMMLEWAIQNPRLALTALVGLSGWSWTRLQSRQPKT